jgi:hypothetical protein
MIVFDTVTILSVPIGFASRTRRSRGIIPKMEGDSAPRFLPSTGAPRDTQVEIIRIHSFFIGIIEIEPTCL